MKYKRRIKFVTMLTAASLCISAGAITVTTADYGIGTVVNGTPADATAELGYVQLLIDIWDGTKTPGTYQFGNHSDTFAALSGSLVPASLTAPTTTSPNSEQFSGQNNSATLNLGSGAQFLLTKWGGGDILFYVAGLSGNVTVMNNQIHPGGQFTGLSHFEIFGGSVADRSSTLVLLGSTLLGLACVRSRLARN